jgi:hypothetical protein
VGSNGVGVDDRGTTTGNCSPDTALRVEDGQFEQSASRAVKFLDICFPWSIMTERHWPDYKK